MTDVLDSLHLPTLLVLLGFVEVLKFGALTALWLPNRKEPGLGGWWLGYLLTDIGLCFALGRVVLSIPLPLAAFMGTAFLLVGMYVTTVGTWDFMERPRPWGRRHGPALLVLGVIQALATYFIFVSPSFEIRLLLVASVATFMTLAQIVALWPMWRDRFHPMGKFLLFCLCLTLIGHAARLGHSVLGIGPVSESVIDDTPDNIRLIVVSIIHAWLMGFGQIGVIAEKLMKRLRLQADRDPLTGLNNRQAFLESTIVAHVKASREKAPFSLLVIDPDRFRRINDNLGQIAGDRTLNHVANLLSTVTRKHDILGHVGGGVFALALPGADRHEAMAIAEAARALVEHHPVPIRPGPIVITVSIGVVTNQPSLEMETGPPRHMNTLLQIAEETLAEAKERGRNIVVHEADHATSSPTSGDARLAAQT